MFDLIPNPAPFYNANASDSPSEAFDVPETQISILKEISDFKTLMKLRLVSKMFDDCVKATIVHRYCLNSATKLHFVMINFDNIDHSLDSNLDFIGDYASAISVFNIHDFKFNKSLRDVFIHLAEHLPNLEKLSLNNCHIKIPLFGITHFKCLKNLQFIQNKNITPFDLSFISKIPFLETLNLYRSDYVPESLLQLTSKHFSIIWGSGATYEGAFCKGLSYGMGKATYSNGDKYEGDFFDGRRHGKGTLIFFDGTKYEGDFLYNRFHGYGTTIFASGDKYTGEFKNGLMNGKGTYTFNDGLICDGDFLNGNFIG